MRALLPALAFMATAQAQTFVVPQPDCLIFFHFTVTGQTSPTSPNLGLDNRTNGCTTWNVSFTSVTLTNATITLQSAPNTSTGVPGAWVTYLNQVVLTGTNPLTIAATPAAGFTWVVGYNPWVRILLTIAGGPAAGVVDGAAYGWRIPSAGSSPVATANVNIVSPLGQAVMASSIPVVIASNQSAVAEGVLNSAGTVVTPDYCTLKAPFAYAAASGAVQIVAVSGGTTIRVCHVSFAADAPTNVKLISGTGAACVAGPADETGTYQNISAIALDFDTGPLVITAAKALCFNSSASVTGGGTVTYSQR